LSTGAAGAEEAKLIRSAHSGDWSDPATWTGGKLPGRGARVQIASGHKVKYDVASEAPIRLIHIAGTLEFARDRDTLLNVGLLRIEPGDNASEDGFDCEHVVAPSGHSARPALLIGTPEAPIPAQHTAVIRLVHFEGMNVETLPAIVNCAGRWEVHGAPLSRTWVELGASTEPGTTRLTLSEPAAGWKAGDQVIVTASANARRTHGHKSTLRGSAVLETEQRRIAAIEGTTLTLDRPLEFAHFGDGEHRSEVANLSRNVVIESADPAGVRGHTMYHHHSQGGISYAEFRHLGKEGVLGKYPIHFHLVGDTMRGSGVIGASVWDSHNRWITVHGTDYLLVRDCVGYRSVGHGFFLEDATEQYNVLDRNLAVQAYAGRPLPKQVLPFDLNEGAGFWWANGRNTLTRNVACENDRYGFFFEIARSDEFDSVMPLRAPTGETVSIDVRGIPFFRFEDNEVHSQRFYGFKFGEHGTGVSGDREHPFIARNLTAWQTHYLIRPDVAYFLLDGFQVGSGTYAVYQADYDHHVYRNLHLSAISNRAFGFAGRADGHGRGGIQQGPFTVENVTFDNVRTSQPLVCMNITASRPEAVSHFRNLQIVGERPSRNVFDIEPGERGLAGDSSRSPTCYLHDYPAKGRTLQFVGTNFPQQIAAGDYSEVEGLTGPLVRAAAVKDVEFPELLAPIDDLPPATLILSARLVGRRLQLRGLAHDNREVQEVQVNDRPAKIVARHAGVVEWEAELEPAAGERIAARSIDAQGNVEVRAHELHPAK
jgi:hypothetical protein